MKKIILVSFLLICGCSFKKSSIENQTPTGHEELYSEPEETKARSPGSGVKRIVIAATNDVGAMYAPMALELEDVHNKGTQKIQVGGLDAMKAYLAALREHYKNVVLVDSGNIFSSKSKLKEVQDFYKSLNYDAITVGLGDFALKLPAGTSSNTQLFKDFANGSETPLILSNLYDVKTARTVEWKGSLPHLIKEVDGMKIGIIGILPDDVIQNTPVDNRVGHFIENMLQSTLRQARLLRSLGADLIVVLTHQGIPCGHNLANASKLPLTKVNFEPERPGVCELNNALGTYLERLPPKLVDVVIGGRLNQKMANFVNGTLVLSSFGNGKSMSYAEFFIDTKEKSIIEDKTIVHQPIMFCREFFKETNDCYTEDTSINHQMRVPATFLGRKLNLSIEPSAPSAKASPVFDYNEAMIKLDAAIVFAPETSGHSQLIMIKMNGKKLLEVLEGEYNTGNQGRWLPSPFILKDNNLHLSIKDQPIDLDKDYLILSDLEGLQKNRSLRKLLLSSNAKALMPYSWTSFSQSDSVGTKMAVQER